MRHDRGRALSKQRLRLVPFEAGKGLLRVFLLLGSGGIALLLLLHLLLHLLLLKKLALLHLLHDFLRGAHLAIRRRPRLALIWWLSSGSGNCGNSFFGLLGLFWLVDGFVVVLIRLLHLLLLRVGSGLWIGSATVPWSENDLAWRTVTEISGEKYVEAGSLQELEKNVACLAGAVTAEDALVGNVADDLGSGIGRDLSEDLLKTGVGCIDAQAACIPDDGWRIGSVVDGPFGHGRRSGSWGDLLRGKNLFCGTMRFAGARGGLS